MRVLHIIDHYHSNSGGTEQQFFSLLKHHIAAGLDLQVIILYHYTDYLQNYGLPALHSELYLKGISQPRTLPILLGLARELRRQRIDILHSWFPESAMLGPWLGRLIGARHVTSRRDLGFWYTRPKLAVLRQGARLTDRYFANSAAVAKNVTRCEGISSSRITTIPNSVDLELLSSIVPIDVRRQLGIPTGARVIGIAANLRPVKRVDDLIRATHMLIEAGHDVHVLSIGENSALLGKYQGLCGQLGLGRRVHFLGHLEREVALSWIAGCDIAVNCSASEGSPNSVLEALALGIPVVATNVGGSAEIVADGVSGLLVPPDAPRQLANAIEKLIGAPDFAARLATTAKSIVQGRHSPTAIAREYIAAYEADIRAAETISHG